MDTRECARCHEDLPLEDFNVLNVHTREDGHKKQSWCKECFKEYYQDYHREIPNPAAEDGRRYVPVERIEFDPDFAKKDAARRAAMVHR